MPDIGHNSNDPQLRTIVERIERLEDEISDKREDLKEIYAEAKSSGYDVKILRKVVSRRKKRREQIEEEDTLIDTYERNLGVFA